MRKRIHRFHLKKIFLLACLLGCIAVVIAALGILYVWKTIPPPTLLENREVAESTKIYDRTGTILLYEVHGEERRTVIPFVKIPQTVKNATISAEDANFYTHTAFDWKSIIRALLVNLGRGEIVQGGSTITQQLAKKAFLSDERTILRKLRELIIAFRLERQFTKDQILEAYLNQIPYGSNAYGIEAASQTFFGKPTADLDLSEAATLAALPKAPTFYSPFGPNRKALIARRDYILNQMEKSGFISEQEKEAAAADPPPFAKPSSGIRAPHFVMSVLENLNERYGEDFVRTNGLVVTTTLDWELQQLAESAVTEQAIKNEELYQGTNAALVAENPRTGEILALVGSKDYFDTKHDGNFNVVTQGLRQPGSAMKPFIYAAAFEKGYTPDTALFDVETEFDATGDPEKSYKPQNYDGRFRGPLTFRRALAQSLNVPSVKVLYLVGMDTALQTLRDFGLTTLTERSRYGLSLILGGGEVKLVDLVGAYAALSQDGIRHSQSLILKIETKNKVLESYRDEIRNVIEPQFARLVNDILSDQSSRAPIFGTSLTLPTVPDYQVAVKTGTSNDYRDAWTVGYTPSLVVGVWAGNNDNTPMTKAGGNLAAAPIWRRVMSEVLAKLPPESFTKPDDIFVEKQVLKGEYMVTYQLNGVSYPQIHSILFYVNRDDPQGPEPLRPENDSQFQNWEQPVLAWVQSNVPNPQLVNQPIPIGATAGGTSPVHLISPLAVSLEKPMNGDFVANAIIVDATITAGAPISKIELYWNNTVIDTKLGNFGTSFSYHNALNLGVVELQNLLALVATDNSNNQTREEIILFKQP